MLDHHKVHSFTRNLTQRGLIGYTCLWLSTFKFLIIKWEEKFEATHCSFLQNLQQCRHKEWLVSQTICLFPLMKRFLLVCKPCN